MSASTDAEKYSVSLRTAPLDAWRVLLEPQYYSRATHRALFESGADAWASGGEMGSEAITATCDRLGVAAVNSPGRDAIIDDPEVPIKHPGQLAVVTAVGAHALRTNEVLQDHPRALRADQMVYEFLLDHLYSALQTHPDRGALWEIVVEAVYGADYPTSENPIESITEREELVYDAETEAGWYGVPITIANEAETMYRNPSVVEMEGCVERDGRRWMPCERLASVIDEYIVDPITGVGPQLRVALTAAARGGLIATIANGMDDLDARVSQLQRLGQTKNLYKSRQSKRRLDALLKAVGVAPASMVEQGEYYPARTYLQAVYWYQELSPEEGRWKLNPAVTVEYQQALKSFQSAQEIGTFLGKNDDCAAVAKRHSEPRDQIEYRLSVDVRPE